MIQFFVRWFLVCVLISTYCNGFKIYFPHEDTWEEEHESFREARYQNFQFIFPGTKWCGTGNIAANNDDLGSSVETDMCCREHDQCPDIIEARQSNYNLTNDSFYTRLNCKCDEMFYDCLKSTSRRSSKVVGTIYFNVLGTKCYRKDYPIVKCIEYHSVIKNRCIVYELDETQPPIYEWFDVSPF